MSLRPQLFRTAIVAVAVQLSAQAPLQVGVEVPGVLDLRGASAADWVPADTRDPALVQAKSDAWAAKVAPLLGRASVRILLPAGPGRIPLLLAASQAIRARNASSSLYLAYDPAGEPIWDEAAWGAVQGGALLAEDLGPDPAAWRDLLMKAQGFLPGRPWTLWLPSDPGPRLAQLLGDGGRVVLPPGGPGDALAAQVPPGFTEVEGGTGTLLLREPRTRDERRWAFNGGVWRAVAGKETRHEVGVTGEAAYDVGALLAKVRAERLAESLRIHTLEADLAVDLHLQAPQGPGQDLGFRFRTYRVTGEPEETLQKELLFNGVKAKLSPGLQIPIIEPHVSLAAPAALALTERYHYRDGGAAGPGQRRLLVTPVDKDHLLFTGSLLVEEASGRILEERRTRTELPGIVKSEAQTLTYGEAAPGFWTLVKAEIFERWVVSGTVAQVQRNLAFSNFEVNGAGFNGHRLAARTSDGTMLQVTPDGLRYFNKQKDGTRKAEDRPRSSTLGAGGLMVVDPTLPFPVIPLAALFYNDFNAWNKGIQVSALTAIVLNQGQISVPNIGAGFSLSASSVAMLLPSTERVISDGRLLDGEGVGHSFGNAALGLGHDLGWGFRLQGTGRFTYDAYRKPLKGDNWTDGFVLPPSGWTREALGQLSWMGGGFQLVGDYGVGQRPAGPYGLPGALEETPDGGRFNRWGGHAGYDYEFTKDHWLHVESGYQGGGGFDRFLSLDAGGVGGDVRVAGLRSGTVAARDLTYVKGAVVLPTGPHLRLTLSLDQAWLQMLDDPATYHFTGLGIAGDLPGFWVFTTVRVDLGVGLASTLPGARSFNGFVAFLRVF